MQLRDKIFIPLFVLAFLISLFLLGGNLTGKFVFVDQSMYCEEGECFPYCISTSECDVVGQKCCQKNDFGICQEDCEKEFEYIPSQYPDYEENLRKTSKETNNLIFSATTLIVLLTGVLYYFSRRTHKRLKKKN